MPRRRQVVMRKVALLELTWECVKMNMLMLSTAVITAMDIVAMAAGPAVCGPFAYVMRHLGLLTTAWQLLLMLQTSSGGPGQQSAV